MPATRRLALPAACLLLLASVAGWTLLEQTAPLRAQGHGAVVARTAAPAPAVARSVDAAGMTVADMDRSLAFFTNVLTFEKVSDIEVSGAEYDRLQGLFGVRMRVVRMRLGDEQVELTEYLTPRGRRIPEDSKSNDRWFQHVAIIVSDMDAAYVRLRMHRVEHASPEPQRLPDWNAAAGGIKAFYFKDPDGHALEVLEFPAGKGDPKWHALAARDPARLFLGIDHTAIVVGDTAASLAFYQDLLGLRIAGQSTNFGIEQERLNNVFGARLQITALRAERGPGVEFLEYLTPRNGRRAEGIQSNDLAHWETTLTTSAADDVFQRLQRVARRGSALLVSPAVAMLSELGLRKGLVVQDPDGHAVKVIER